MSTGIIKGTIASPGIKIGKAFVFKSDNFVIPRIKLKDNLVKDEVKRFNEAVTQTKGEIKKIKDQIEIGLSKEMGDIFSSHLMVLEDPLIVEKARRMIVEEKRNAEWVINDISMELIQSLDKIEDEYLRERIIDISDINKRLIGHLQKSKQISLADIKEEVIVISSDLTPSETAMMNKEYILSFVTDKGGKTSHTAIMARAMEIPAIVGAIDATSQITNGDTVIVDAVHGQVIVNPTEREIKEFRKYQKEFDNLEIELAKLTSLPAQTIDQTEIFIYGNIEIPEERKIIKDHGAQGIGLFRSEFLFLDRSLPDEEYQFQEYKKVVQFFKPMPVVIRTLDVGGDKIYAYDKPSRERNPFLGMRAIRFSLINEDLFRIQLRAIIRASHYGNVKLMFPMISTIEEFLRAKMITLEIMDELRTKGIPFKGNIPIGIMIEVPSAAIYADKLAKHADFFSVGTNDLVQYLLAVDRINEKIAYLYNPLNLAVLRLLKHVVDIADANKVPISICGEMAGEPRYTMMLLGLGFRHFSMSPTYMYKVKRILRSVDIAECLALVKECMELEKTEDIEKIVFNKFKKKFPEMII